MRFLHTADWHLGRYFHGTSLIEDQSHVLDQLVDIVRSERVDAVFIAGDVYDRAVPPADAVALLDDILARLVLQLGVRVILVAGNHDSPDRIGFAGRVAERQGLILRGTLDHLDPVAFDDRYGRILVHPLPYVEPAFARRFLRIQSGDEGASDYQDAMSRMIAWIAKRFEAGQRNVLVGHAFVAGGSESESERPLSVGGSGSIAPVTFDGFDYVALGHLHRPQSVGREAIQYAGSLLKYSFNEVSHVKSVTVVELGEHAAVSMERIPLRPKHDVRCITGGLSELLQMRRPDLPRDDYLRVVLTDRDPVLDPMGRLREVYPRVMDLQFEGIGYGSESSSAVGRNHRQRSPEELFAAFHRDMLEDEIDAPSLEVFREAVRAVSGADAERSE